MKPMLQRTSILAALGFLFVLTAPLRPTAAQNHDLSPEQVHELSMKVMDIFMQKCNECHGSHLAKPDGFGFMDDFERLVKEDNYLIPGKPDESYVFETVVMEEDDPEFMPPTDSDTPPLTKEEIETFRYWVQIGAPFSPEAQARKGKYPEEIEGKTPAQATTTPPKNTTGTTPDATGTPDTTPTTTTDTTPAPPGKTKRTLSTTERWQKFFGQFHAASTHMPIGLLVAAFLAEFLAMFNGSDRLRFVARFCLVFGTLGAIYSTASGWWIGTTFAYDRLSDYPGMLFVANPRRGMDIYWHRWLGVLTPIVSIVCTILAYMAERSHNREGGNKAIIITYRLSLLFLVVLVSIVGLLGGNLIGEGTGPGHKWHYKLPGQF